MSKLGFTLIELLIVIFLISFVSFLAIKLPTIDKTYTFSDLRELLYPNGELIITKEKVVVVKDGKEKEINFRFDDFEVYDVFFEKKEFKNALFKYKIKNGIGDALIVKEKKVYMFRPLWVREFKTLTEAKNYIFKLNESIK